jgi:hypothetical protein
MPLPLTKLLRAASTRYLLNLGKRMLKMASEAWCEEQALRIANKLQRLMKNQNPIRRDADRVPNN